MVVRVTFSLRFDPCRDIIPAELLRDRIDPLQEDKAEHLVDDLGQYAPHDGTGDVHCPDEQSCL